MYKMYLPNPQGSFKFLIMVKIKRSGCKATAYIKKQEAKGKFIMLNQYSPSPANKNAN